MFLQMFVLNKLALFLYCKWTNSDMGEKKPQSLTILNEFTFMYFEINPLRNSINNCVCVCERDREMTEWSYCHFCVLWSTQLYFNEVSSLSFMWNISQISTRVGNELLIYFMNSSRFLTLRVPSVLIMLHQPLSFAQSGAQSSAHT